MIEEKKGREHQSLREDYFAGKITVEEYVEKRNNSKEGDRRRRAILREFNATQEKLARLF
ncbi:hypothetical protein JOC37_002519 [Desulfohalotomaculum tongense]|uniref:hypothetical protein n=1 Tax=Desulforadius tongensis TaxID=1216062 RepID=UPI00195D1D82|nr:hypothetical protein [Desulforadius tongensis]MBM7856094.1 hypothetical protein [Desulforadius tongensis]